MFKQHHRVSTFALAPVLLTCGLCLSMPASADVIIAHYDFGASPTSSQVDSVDTQAQSTAADIGWNYPNAGTTTTLGGSAFIRTNETADSEAGALSNYFTFTITPDSGYQIDYSTLQFDILLDTDSAFNGTWFVRSSVDGFTATLGSRNAPVSSVDTNIATISPAIDLSGLAVQSGAVEFRLYTYDNANSSGIVHRLDNVIARGDVSLIPEPTAAAMVALGAVALMCRRTRRY